MSSDEDDLFSAAMSDVVPLKRARRAALTQDKSRERDSSLDHRRRAAEDLPAGDRNTLSDSAIEPLDAWYVLTCKRPGRAERSISQAEAGPVRGESRLDLHRMTVEIAAVAMFEFVEEAHSYGLRSVLVIHGKGESKAEQQRSSILKGCVDHWLRELDVVQAFHSAQPRHGGTGAVYVLLRKSEAEKARKPSEICQGAYADGPGISGGCRRGASASARAGRLQNSAIGRAMAVGRHDIEDRSSVLAGGIEVALFAKKKIHK